MYSSRQDEKEFGLKLSWKTNKNTKRRWINLSFFPFCVVFQRWDNQECCLISCHLKNWGLGKFWPDLDKLFDRRKILKHFNNILWKENNLKSPNTPKFNDFRKFDEVISYILKQTEICFWELIFCKLYKVIKFRYLLRDNTIIIPLGLVLCIFLPIRWSILSELF